MAEKAWRLGRKDEEIVELESEKASQALTSEDAGVLREIKVQEGEFAKVGDVLCVLKKGDKPRQQRFGDGSRSRWRIRDRRRRSAARPQSADWIMPAAERVLSEYQISADAIKPTGPGGRLLKEDVLNYVQQKGLETGTANASPGSRRAGRSCHASAPVSRPASKPIRSSQPDHAAVGRRLASANRAKKKRFR